MDEKQNGKKMPSLADMLGGRVNTEAYCFFIYHFVKRTILAHKFKKYFLRKGASVNALFSVSDKAYTMVMLEERWNFWCDNAEELQKRVVTIPSKKMRQKEKSIQ